MKYDCIIPYGPNDDSMINLCIENARKYLVDLQNIYVISYDLNFKHPLAITISEIEYPFKYKDVYSYIQTDRTGWYLQQLLKMYAHRVIPNISEYFLILDSDTIFLKHTTMFENDVPLYSYGTEYHIPYFTHMQLLHPSFLKTCNVSGICHHMMFKKEFLENIFKMIENLHSASFWKIFLEKAGVNVGSNASEYEIYFTYLHLYQKEKFKIRKLQFLNSHSLNVNREGLDYISVHHYLRR
jgi:hypothetical protein